MYYAVYRGAKPGVYNNWNDCKLQTFRFQNAKYKKFKNFQEATYFSKYGTEKVVKQCSLDNYLKLEKKQFNQNFDTLSQNSTLSQDSNLSEDSTLSQDSNLSQDSTLSEDSTSTNIDPNQIYVYTDGCCINNGKPQAKAGIGVYFGENDSRNISKKIDGKQTNNVAEITAIIETIILLKNELEHNKIINIFTDSKYSITCCSTYGSKLEKKKWTDKKEIPNLQLVKKAYNLCKLYKNIKLHHIKAHTGKNDIHSVGNFHADRLANEAVLL